MNDTPAPPIRAFFAIDPPTALCESIDQAVEQLRGLPEGDKIRWVKPENLHVTLKFFAALNPETIPALVEAVGKEVAGVQPFTSRLGTLHAFPSERRPRVLAWDLEPEEPVIDLAQAVERGASACGFTPEDRPFRAHLTAARLRNRRYPDLSHAPDITATEWPIQEVRLIQSDLQPTGPIYTILHRFPLVVNR